MQLITLINQLKNYKKGTFINIEYKSKPKPLAAHKDDVIEKVTTGTYRLGISYRNLKSQKEKQTGPLPFGEWESDPLTNYVITREDKKTNAKINYLRIYTVNGKKSKSVYYLNGQEITKEYLIENNYLGKSENNNHTECFTVFLENVIKLG